MRVLFDASVLGLAVDDPRARSGVWRVVEQYVWGLGEVDGVELDLCASYSATAYYRLREQLRASPISGGSLMSSPRSRDFAEAASTSLIALILIQQLTWRRAADKNGCAY